MSRNVNRDKEVFVKRVRDASGDEDKAVALLEEVRWGSGPACVHCGSASVARQMKSDGTRSDFYRWHCRACRKAYSVRHGTVFAESRLPLRHWLHAFWRVVSSKKGVSAKQVSRECGITYKSGLFLMHRIRLAMKQGGLIGGGGKTVEADETYVGGKPRKKGVSKRGRGTSKTPVMGMVERSGQVRCCKLGGTSARHLQHALRAHLDPDSKLVTDDYGPYARLAGAYLDHATVKHSIGEYVKAEDPSVHTNTIEGVFAILKRGILGTYHSISDKHMHRYLDEFSFRYNRRKMTDGERLHSALLNASGRRMTYRQQLEGAGSNPGVAADGTE